MLKYGALAKAIELMCFKPALKRLSELREDIDIRAYKKEVKRQYKQMLERTQDIGGSSLEKNLYIAAFVFSLYKALPDVITPELINKMVDSVFNSSFLKRMHKNKKCTLFTDKVQDKKVLESRRSLNSKYDLDWKFVYQKGDGEFYNTYTECGICKLAKQEGCFEFAPCLCNMDERSYRLEGGLLHRTKTLAEGGDCCDFYVTKLS